MSGHDKAVSEEHYSTLIWGMNYIFLDKQFSFILLSNITYSFTMAFLRLDAFMVVTFVFCCLFLVGWSYWGFSSLIIFLLAVACRFSASVFYPHILCQLLREKPDLSKREKN